ncbi:ribonuclease H-like domain-containing protein [Tanacetum coccineum]
MDLETAQTTITTKFPILKQGEYDMWRLRIEQYFQVQVYALWDVIENGNSFKPVPQTTTNANGSLTSLIPGPVTTKEKDAQTLFAAIQTRFGGNEATKKTQKTLLKQMYENFSAPSTESLDSIFNRLQKIVSQLAILGENISQEDLNLKFLRSLPSEWNTHVVVWRNKHDLDTMSFDDLYNNFKIVKQEVKGTASSSSSSQNMAFVSSPSSTNEVNTAYGVSTANTQVSPASTQVSTASTQVSTANLSDDTVYAFLASQPNGSQLVYEDLEQIHEDDIEEMDLKWQLALLSMRTRSVKESPDAPLVKELVLDDKLEKKIVFPTVAKIECIRPKQQEKLVRKPVKHMTGNMSNLSDFKEFNGGYVTFGGGAKGGKITGKLTLKTGKLDFEDVYFVKELQFNLFSDSYMCDKKNSVLFTDTGCFVLSPNFKLADESQVLLKVPRKNNMYSVDIKNIIPKESLTCLHKDETSGILKSFITEIENLVDKKVKIIRCDNGTEFKNRVMSKFYEKKGIKKEFSVARISQQNGVDERRNMTLIVAARTMLVDSKLPTTFWAKEVNTAFYVHNRVLVVKPYNKTPYELFRGRTPALSFMRPFGCHITILNTLDYLGKFDGKLYEGFFVGYSINSKAFRVYNIRTTKVEENLHSSWRISLLLQVQKKVLVQNASNNEPQPSSDNGKKDDEGVNKESGIDDQERPESSTQDVNIVRPSINTASTNVNTGRAHKGNPSIKRSKLDRSYARRAFVVQVTTSLDLGGFTIWQKSHWIEAIRLFLDYTSFKDIIVYQMDVKSAFLYGKIEEEVYIYQPLGAKTTAWNEFSSTMASAIICLSTNQNFNFSKYIFDNMVKNFEGRVKFIMYPRFLQVFLNKQVEGMTKHKEDYVTPSHTKKVFANMKREGKGFSGRVTPLFQTMIVQAPEELGKGSKIPTDLQHTTTIIQPSTSQPHKKQLRRKQRKYTEVP